MENSLITMQRVVIAGLIVDLIGAILLLVPDLPILQKVICLNERINLATEIKQRLNNPNKDTSEIADDITELVNTLQTRGTLVDFERKDLIFSSGTDEYDLIVDIIDYYSETPFDPEEIIITSEQSEIRRIINNMISEYGIEELNDMSVSRLENEIDMGANETGIIFISDSDIQKASSKSDLERWLDDYPRRRFFKWGAVVLACGFGLQILSNFV